MKTPQAAGLILLVFAGLAIGCASDDQDVSKEERSDCPYALEFEDLPYIPTRDRGTRGASLGQASIQCTSDTMEVYRDGTIDPEVLFVDTKGFRWAGEGYIWTDRAHPLYRWWLTTRRTPRRACEKRIRTVRGTVTISGGATLIIDDGLGIFLEADTRLNTPHRNGVAYVPKGQRVTVKGRQCTGANEEGLLATQISAS